MQAYTKKPMSIEGLANLLMARGLSADFSDKASKACITANKIANGLVIVEG